MLLVVLGAAQGEGGSGLTRIDGIRVGQHTLEERPTGCTVVLTEKGAVASVDVRGSAPGTRETDLLDPINTVERVHAIVLSGGSAFGLDAASGVVRFLDERDIGFDVGIAKVPIVPAAILFDLGVGGKPDIRPGADCGYKAAEKATAGKIAEGNVGAGAGATVGKSAGPSRAMKAGIGTAAIELPNGLIVAALMAGQRRGRRDRPRNRRGRGGRAIRRRNSARRCAQAPALRSSHPNARRSEHDDRNRRHERVVDENPGEQSRANGA